MSPHSAGWPRQRQRWRYGDNCPSCIADWHRHFALSLAGMALQHFAASHVYSCTVTYMASKAASAAAEATLSCDSGSSSPDGARVQTPCTPLVGIVSVAASSCESDIAALFRGCTPNQPKRNLSDAGPVPLGSCALRHTPGCEFDRPIPRSRAHRVLVGVPHRFLSFSAAAAVSK